MPPGWGATRARVLARDGHRCRRCGQRATEVHHTVPGVEADELLVSLCTPCHAVISAEQAAEARRLARP
jgi:5-methylcytosine-specific restriction endonuclease McrA